MLDNKIILSVLYVYTWFRRRILQVTWVYPYLYIAMHVQFCYKYIYNIILRRKEKTSYKTLKTIKSNFIAKSCYGTIFLLQAIERKRKTGHEKLLLLQTAKEFDQLHSSEISQ